MAKRRLRTRYKNKRRIRRVKIITIVVTSTSVVVGCMFVGLKYFDAPNRETRIPSESVIRPASPPTPPNSFLDIRLGGD
jgi:hypothetical protein